MSDEEPGTRPFAVTVYATDGTPCVLSGRMRTWEGLPEYEREEIVKILADVLVKDTREHMAGRPHVRADGELIYLVPWQGERVAVSRCPDPVSRKRLVELLSDEVFKLPVATPLREVHAALVAFQQEMLAHPPRSRRRKSRARTPGSDGEKK